MAPPLLQVDALHSPHGGPYSFTLRAGECIAVVGRSGSGKSVLLRLVADLDPHQGEVWLEGRARSGWPAPAWRRQVVYQAAEPAWWAPTAEEHMSGQTAGALAPWLEQLGLGPQALLAEVARLSTGERQRMALLRSLARQPRVLLLDEPTASLDAASVLAVEQLLQARMRETGLAVVFVTHSREQAERIGHRLVEVRDHRLHPVG
ncbi:hypothetical protein RD110_10330 [Rhodoferax koreense]|uniref:ABC transporter domain-containing protein n=1 Tax=Rhodoferax koreensis TaxID=1842727 RepID=A0A1P8K3V3_9BURK|nr:hypothetical protein RD110_10330 [Rhodoferax koreense]